MDHLTDKHGRILSYVRISVTDRCNFRCRYCMPEEGIPWNPHNRIMKYEDILFLVEILREMGVRKIRLTGGEPLVRKGFPAFLKELRTSFPELRLGLTTNGSLLSVYEKEIKDASLDSLNISLDTLDPEKFSYISRIGDLSTVLEGISHFAGQKRPELKFNTVLLKDFNDKEIPDLLEFARTSGAIFRMIEFMPLDDLWAEKSFIPADQILERLLKFGNWENLGGSNEQMNGPAQYYRNPETGQIIGIIAAVSNHFCSSCNRLRVTSMGEMRPCLFSQEGVQLLDIIQRKDRISLKEGILKAVSMKPSGWMNVVHKGCKMSRIGG